MAAALIEMQRNCAEGGLYVCREKGTILMQTLGVQIKHIYGEDLTWGDADWARRDLGEAAAKGTRPWVFQREIPQLPSKSNQIEEFFIDESIVLDQNSRFGLILLWYRAGHTVCPRAAADCPVAGMKLRGWSSRNIQKNFGIPTKNSIMAEHDSVLRCPVGAKRTWD